MPPSSRHKNIAPRPPVLDQQQIQGQQLRVQRREDRQREELGVHPGSASIGHRAVLVARAGWRRRTTVQPFPG
jgi:hypothetical protein